ALRAVLLFHLHTLSRHGERTLPPRLYPAPLEFKHQADITLDLFADALDDNRLRVVRSGTQHRLNRLALCTCCLVSGRGRDTKLGEARNDVAMRAMDGVIEQFDQSLLDLLGDDVLPSARLGGYFFPRHPDDAHEQA